MKIDLNNKGFTLIEMIVSIAIFTVVALIAVGALLKVVDANKKAQTLKTAMNNLNFAMDSMTREMRVGSNYFCTTHTYLMDGSGVLPEAAGGSCEAPVTNWKIYFYSSKVYPPAPATPQCRLIYAYRYNSAPNPPRIEKAESTSCSDVFNDDSFVAITSPEVQFTIATVKLNTADNLQSYAQFHLTGYAGTIGTKSSSDFDIQTSISQRLPD